MAHTTEMESQDTRVRQEPHGEHASHSNAPARRTGISIIGDVPWATHFCQFYQTKQDLIDILVPYIKAGLESNEFCMWVTADNLDMGEAEQALRAAMPDFDRYLERGAIVILPYTEWYLDDGEFDRHKVLNSWVERLNEALSMGFDGARVTGDTMWLNKSHWQDFKEYEESINNFIGDYPLLVLCTYSLDKCGASEIADVVANHEFAVMKRAGEWTIIESADYKQTKDTLHVALGELEDAKEELECMNEELMASAEELRREIEWRKQMELDMNRAQAVAHTGSWRLDIRRNELLWSDETYRLFGVSKDTPLTYETFLGAVHPDDREFVDTSWQAAIRGEPYDIEHRIIVGDMVKWVREQAELEFGAQGELLGGFGTVQDITERKQTDEALRESEQRVRLKLDSILSPEGDIGNLELADIIDAVAIQSAMDDFYKLAQIPMAIIDLKGTVLVGAGWQDICTKFHRVHPEACSNCIESDTLLTAGVPQGEFMLYKCKNNMWDIATPIVVGGKHVGNIFSGQFIFEGEALDYDLFRSQAKKYGFNEEEYIAALERVPRLSRESVDSAMAFFVKLADLLSQLSYSNIKLARSLAERDNLMDSLQESEAFNRGIIESSHDCIKVLDIDGNLLSINPGGLKLLEIEDVCSVIGLRWVDFWKGDDHKAATDAVEKARSGGIGKFNGYCPTNSGVPKWWDVVVTPIPDAEGKPEKLLSVSRDVTERVEFERQREDLFEREHHIAKVLQEAIVPPDVPTELLGYRIAVRYRPALREAEVGGDFYDVFDLGDGKFGVLIGDVAGKGLPAAIRVAAARYSIRSYAYIDPRPARVIELANDALCRDTGDEFSMLTALFAIIDTNLGSITYSSAGHEPPVIQNSEGHSEVLEYGGIPIGVLPGAVYMQTSRRINLGDSIIMVTDGITEARAPGPILFGRKRMVECLNKNRCESPDEMATVLLGAATTHADGHLQDDAAIVVIRCEKEQAR